MLEREKYSSKPGANRRGIRVGTSCEAVGTGDSVPESVSVTVVDDALHRGIVNDDKTVARFLEISAEEFP